MLWIKPITLPVLTILCKGVNIRLMFASLNSNTLLWFVLGEIQVVLEESERFNLVKLLNSILGHLQKDKVSKIEDGITYYAEDYACVPDPEKPSTWKLRLASGESGNITVAQLGAASAAFSEGGFRGNRVELPDECGEEAVKERIRSEYKKLNVDKIPDSIKSLSKPRFTIFKSGGTYYWLGVFSSKFRDDDRPKQEIVSSDAHRKFVDAVNNGLAPYPDLYIWHIEVPIGKATHLFYDDNGFPLAMGTFLYKSMAEALLESDEDLAMSHGMEPQSIIRDVNDPTIINSYISSEITVLPRDVAANKFTDFYLLADHGGGDDMIQDRDRLVNILGEENVAFLEENLAMTAAKAIDDGRDYKSTEVTMDEEELKEAPVEVVEAKVESEDEAVVEEAMDEEMTEDMVEAEAEAEVEGDQVSELRDEIKSAFGILAETIGGFTEAIAEISKRVSELEAKKAVEKSVTRESLIDILTKSAANPVSAVDSDQTIVPDAATLGAPVQTKQEKAGLFFAGWQN